MTFLLAITDTLTTRDEEVQLSFSVYLKTTHMGQYLQFDFFQPLQHKLGVIHTLHYRCHAIFTSDEAILAVLEHFKKFLSISGYTRSALDVAITARLSRPQTSHS